MMTAISRRRFFGASAIGAAAPLTLIGSKAQAASAMRWIEGGPLANYPSQDYESVRSTVGMSHANLEGVRKLVTDRPALAKATWDWGFGDSETALGAASHTGQREIAELLIAHGARPDIFTFAMLGQVDVVKAYCTANPGIQKIHGPHGITLLQHARDGGDEAKLVVEYLTELGDADNKTQDLPLDDETAKLYAGDYESEQLPGAKITVGVHQRIKCLTFTVNAGSMRFLVHRATHEFSPRGADAVQITFEVVDNAARAFSIRDGALTIAATRSGL